MATTGGTDIEVLSSDNSTVSVFLDRPVNVPGLITLCVFYLIILGVGVWASWKNKAWKSNDTVKVMLAGRSLGPVIGVFTATATWVGGGMINGTSEGIFTPGSGLAWTQAMWGFSLSLFFNGIFFAKKMRGAGYVTVLDPFEKRYGLVTAGLAYIPLLSGDLFWSGAILSALGASLAVILGISHEMGVAVSAAIAVLYTVVGGLYSVIFTDIFQVSCILIGLWLCAGFSMANPVVDNIWSNALKKDEEGGWIGVLEPDARVMAWLDSALLIILGGMPWQAFYARVLSARTPKIAVHLSIAGAVGCVVLTFPAILIGAVARNADWSRTDYGLYFPLPIQEENYPLILPLVLEFLTPLPVAVIGLAAISAAVMSSADSSFFSSASMFARHVYAPIRNNGCPNHKATEGEIMWAMRGCVLVIGILATVTAITVRSIYALFVLCSDFVYVNSFPLFVCVVHIESTNTYGALASYFVTLLLRLLSGEPLLSLPPVIKFPYYDEEKQEQVFLYRTCIALIGFVIIIGVSWITRWAFTSGRLHSKWDFMDVFPQDQDLLRIKEAGKRNEKGEDIWNDDPTFSGPPIHLTHL